MEDQILSTLKQIEIKSCTTNRVVTCEVPTSTDEIPVAVAAGTTRSEDSLPPKFNAEVLENPLLLQGGTQIPWTLDILVQNLNLISHY